MQEKSAGEVLCYLAGLLVAYLEELQYISVNSENQFAYGEKTAYVECLEIIQAWESTRLFHFSFDVEDRFPL